MPARTATRKKTTRKKATRKPATRKKAARKTTRKKTTRRRAADLLGERLPASVSALTKELRADLNAIEKEIQTAGKDARRGLTRVMRDASHQLGVLEARGQKGWRTMSRKARGEVERIVKRVRQAIQKRR
jgi:hypothetical protein